MHLKMYVFIYLFIYNSMHLIFLFKYIFLNTFFFF